MSFQSVEIFLKHVEKVPVILFLLFRIYYEHTVGGEDSSMKFKRRDIVTCGFDPNSVQKWKGNVPEANQPILVYWKINDSKVESGRNC